MSYKIKPVDDHELSLKRSEETKGKKLPKCFKSKVSIEKVNMDVMKNWIQVEIDKLLKDDDIVVDYLYELLVAEEEPEIVSIYLQMCDFLGESDALAFCKKMWELLISAEKDKHGIPSELVEEKKKELRDTKDARKPIETAKERPKAKTNYNRSQYNAEKRSRSPTREPEAQARNYRDRSR